MNATESPVFLTTIDQHQGDHQTGMRIMKLVDIRTSFGDYSQESWESIDGPGKAWWVETLQSIHNANVELAELDSDHRSRAKDYLLDNPTDDVEGCPSAIRAAIEATR